MGADLCSGHGFTETVSEMNTRPGGTSTTYIDEWLAARPEQLEEALAIRGMSHVASNPARLALGAPHHLKHPT